MPAIDPNSGAAAAAAGASQSPAPSAQAKPRFVEFDRATNQFILTLKDGSQVSVHKLHGVEINGQALATAEKTEEIINLLEAEAGSVREALDNVDLSSGKKHSVTFNAIYTEATVTDEAGQVVKDTTGQEVSRKKITTSPQMLATIQKTSPAALQILKKVGERYSQTSGSSASAAHRGMSTNTANSVHSQHATTPLPPAPSKGKGTAAPSQTQSPGSITVQPRTVRTAPAYPLMPSPQLEQLRTQVQANVAQMDNALLRHLSQNDPSRPIDPFKIIQGHQQLLAPMQTYQRQLRNLLVSWEHATGVDPNAKNNAIRLIGDELNKVTRDIAFIAEAGSSEGLPQARILERAADKLTNPETRMSQAEATKLSRFLKPILANLKKFATFAQTPEPVLKQLDKALEQLRLRKHDTRDSRGPVSQYAWSPVAIYAIPYPPNATIFATSASPIQQQPPVGPNPMQYQQTSQPPSSPLGGAGGVPEPVHGHARAAQASAAPAYAPPLEDVGGAPEPIHGHAAPTYAALPPEASLAVTQPAAQKEAYVQAEKSYLANMEALTKEAFDCVINNQTEVNSTSIPAVRCENALRSAQAFSISLQDQIQQTPPGEAQNVLIAHKSEVDKQINTLSAITDPDKTEKGALTPPALLYLATMAGRFATPINEDQIGQMRVALTNIFSQLTSATSEQLQSFNIKPKDIKILKDNIMTSLNELANQSKILSKAADAVWYQSTAKQKADFSNSMRAQIQLELSKTPIAWDRILPVAAELRKVQHDLAVLHQNSEDDPQIREYRRTNEQVNKQLLTSMLEIHGNSTPILPKKEKAILRSLQVSMENTFITRSLPVGPRFSESIAVLKKVMVAALLESPIQTVQGKPIESENLKTARQMLNNLKTGFPAFYNDQVKKDPVFALLTTNLNNLLKPSDPETLRPPKLTASKANVASAPVSIPQHTLQNPAGTIPSPMHSAPQNLAPQPVKSPLTPVDIAFQEQLKQAKQLLAAQDPDPEAAELRELAQIMGIDPNTLEQIQKEDQAEAASAPAANKAVSSPASTPKAMTGKAAEAPGAPSAAVAATKTLKSPASPVPPPLSGAHWDADDDPSPILLTPFDDSAAASPTTKGASVPLSPAPMAGKAAAAPAPEPEPDISLQNASASHTVPAATPAEAPAPATKAAPAPAPSANVEIETIQARLSNLQEQLNYLSGARTNPTNIARLRDDISNQKKLLAQAQQKLRSEMLATPAPSQAAGSTAAAATASAAASPAAPSTEPSPKDFQGLLNDIEQQYEAISPESAAAAPSTPRTPAQPAPSIAAPATPKSAPAPSGEPPAASQPQRGTPVLPSRPQPTVFQLPVPTGEKGATVNDTLSINRINTNLVLSENLRNQISADSENGKPILSLVAQLRQCQEDLYTDIAMLKNSGKPLNEDDLRAISEHTQSNENLLRGMNDRAISQYRASFPFFQKQKTPNTEEAIKKDLHSMNSGSTFKASLTPLADTSPEGSAFIAVLKVAVAKASLTDSSDADKKDVKDMLSGLKRMHPNFYNRMLDNDPTFKSLVNRLQNPSLLAKSGEELIKKALIAPAPKPAPAPGAPSAAAAASRTPQPSPKEAPATSAGSAQPPSGSPQTVVAAANADAALLGYAEVLRSTGPSEYLTIREERIQEAEVFVAQAPRKLQPDEARQLIETLDDIYIRLQHHKAHEATGPKISPEPEKIDPKLNEINIAITRLRTIFPLPEGWTERRNPSTHVREYALEGSNQYQMTFPKA